MKRIQKYKDNGSYFCLSYLLILFFFSFISLPAFEELSFLEILHGDPSRWHEKQVQLRGFLYKDEQGHLILAHEPNLKTCCIGSEAKKAKQVLIICNHIPVLSKSATTITGQFLVNKDSEYGYSLIKN